MKQISNMQKGAWDVGGRLDWNRGETDRMLSRMLEPILIFFLFSFRPPGVQHPITSIINFQMDLIFDEKEGIT